MRRGNRRTPARGVLKRNRRNEERIDQGVDQGFVEPWVQGHYAMADAHMTSQVTVRALLALQRRGISPDKIPTERSYLGSPWKMQKGTLAGIKQRQEPVRQPTIFDAPVKPVEAWARAPRLGPVTG